MTNFPVVFFLAMAVNVGVTFRASEAYQRYQQGMPLQTAIFKTFASLVSADDPNASSEHKAWLVLIKKYLSVYLLAVLSDWLQGPYVYALYADYGYTQHDIAILFVAGFGSSMIFGSFVGGMADWGGRKRFVMLFAFLYALSCMTKHFKNFYILMLGRLLGGVATSLLFSVFDAWLIRSHADAGVKSFLGRSFSVACYGNYLVAIVSGIMANNAASLASMRNVFGGFYWGGYLAPFDMALMALVGCGAICYLKWEENYGDSGSGPVVQSGSVTDDDDDTIADAEAGKPSNSGSTSTAATALLPNIDGAWYNGLRSAALTTMRSQDIMLCGAVSSLFEGSMYIFVFMWTPSLATGTSQELPFGLIFSTFMVCCMAGSSAYSLLEGKFKGEKLAVGIMAMGSISMFLVAISPSNTLKFLGMNLFEFAVGLYWPTMGTMKGAIVPEAKRAAIYNLFRIPLNCIVLFSLLTDLAPTTSFLLNALMLGAAACAQFVLMKRREQYQGLPSSASPKSGKDLESDVVSPLKDALLRHDKEGNSEPAPSKKMDDNV